MYPIDLNNIEGLFFTFFGIFYKGVRAGDMVGLWTWFTLCHNCPTFDCKNITITFFKTKRVGEKYVFIKFTYIEVGFIFFVAELIRQLYDLLTGLCIMFCRLASHCACVNRSFFYWGGMRGWTSFCVKQTAFWFPFVFLFVLVHWGAAWSLK